MLEVKNLSKSFDGNQVLDNINFKVNEGEMVAIVGESGKGKTTLLNIVSLLETPDEGQVIYNGEVLKRNPKEIRKFYRNELGYLFQNYGLIDEETILNNIKYYLPRKYFKDGDDKEIETVLRKLGIKKNLFEKIYKLSGGEQQRVALARIILKEANLIVADEPTGSLDEENEKIVMSALQEMSKQGKIVLVVTHNKEILPYFDRIITL